MLQSLPGDELCLTPAVCQALLGFVRESAGSAKLSREADLRGSFLDQRVCLKAVLHHQSRRTYLRQTVVSELDPELVPELVQDCLEAQRNQQVV